MPRTGRGGPRQGTPGKTYTNRSDLNTNKKLPIQVAPSQQYGQGVAQRSAQQAVPMAGGPALPSPQVSPAAVPAPVPGAGGGLARPTDRPGEPLTAGLPIGPGPGPEALTQPPDFYAEDLGRFRDVLPTLEVLASLPTSSIQTRNFVRRLRGAIPLKQEYERTPADVPTPAAPAMPPALPTEPVI
jgi:hypothetical protein